MPREGVGYRASSPRKARAVRGQGLAVPGQCWPKPAPGPAGRFVKAGSCPSLPYVIQQLSRLPKTCNSKNSPGVLLLATWNTQEFALVAYLVSSPTHLGHRKGRCRLRTRCYRILQRLKHIPRPPPPPTPLMLKFPCREVWSFCIECIALSKSLSLRRCFFLLAILWQKSA